MDGLKYDQKINKIIGRKESENIIWGKDSVLDSGWWKGEVQ